MAGVALVRMVGSGGEGEVWDAQRPDGSRCALKLIRPAVLADPMVVRQRGRWLVRIDHPALVEVVRGGRITTGAYAGWGYLEMGFVEGESLATAAALPDALERLRPVAEALDLLHRGTWSDGVPLIHRDVKPANLIATDGGLVLVDPSTLRDVGALDLTRVGTPRYVAPEVASGRFGPAADVYSLGVTAAALLTGARGEALDRVLADPVAHGLPSGIVEAVRADPAARPASCREVLVHRGTRAARAAATSRPRTGRGLAWLALLAGLSAASAVAWQELPFDVALAVLLGCGVIHLVVHRSRPAVALLLPTLAWGDRIAGAAHRDSRGTGAAWTRATVTGALTAGVAAAGVLGSGGPAAAGLAAGWAALTLRGRWRLLLCPLWLVGAALVVLGGPRRRLLAGLSGRDPDAVHDGAP